VKSLVKVSDLLPVLRMRCGVVSWRGFLWAPRDGLLPQGRLFPTDEWEVAYCVLLLAESPRKPVEAGWVGNVTCHLPWGGEHITSGLLLRLSSPLCFSNPLHGLHGSLHGQRGGCSAEEMGGCG